MVVPPLDSMRHRDFVFSISINRCERLDIPGAFDRVLEAV